MTDMLWSAADIDGPSVHALVIGVSAYDHLLGGVGTATKQPLFGGLGQLSAAATSATRVALWLRDKFDYPEVRLGSVRLLASPSPGELPLPARVKPPAATFDNVDQAVNAWRDDARKAPGNVTLLYVAGHGIQTSMEGGILLLQDAGAPNSTPLKQAIDVASVRRGMVSDLNVADTATPSIQYYFYDACRVMPSPASDYATLPVGVTLDEPKGTAPVTSYVLWGSRSRDFALADAETKTTLFSKAFTDVLDSRAPADTDGRTVRFAYFGIALEAAVAELAESFDEQQHVVPGGSGPLTTPVYLRPAPLRDDGGGTLSRTSRRRQRPVRVRADAGDFVMTVADVNGDVAADGRTNTPVHLPAGNYTVSIALPWGGSVQAGFVVDGLDTDAEVVVDVDVPQQSAGSTTNAPRLDRQLGPTGARSSQWCMRILTWTRDSLGHVASDTPFVVMVDDVKDGTVAMILEAHGPVLQYVQIRTDDGRSLLVALPLLGWSWSDATCWLHVRVTEETLGATVRFTDMIKDTVAGYLTGGRPDHAAAIALSAEHPHNYKMQDHIGAMLEAYALLRLDERDRMHDWARNLAESAWPSDGAIIAGELAARQGDDVLAAELMIQAAWLGLPLFSDGLSLFMNRVPQLLANADVPEPVRRELEAQAAPLRQLGPFAEFATLTTTLHIDPDTRETTSEHGWRRFVRASMPGDPRAFWREP